MKKDKILEILYDFRKELLDKMNIKIRRKL